MQIYQDISNGLPELDEAGRHRLTVLLGSDGMSYAILNPRDDVVACKSWNFTTSEHDTYAPVLTEIRLLLAGEKILGANFGTVTVGILHGLTTMVPNRLFHASDLARYFHLLVQRSDHFHFDAQPIHSIDARMIWALEQEVADLVASYFPTAQVLHAAPALLDRWHLLASDQGFTVMVNVRHQVAQCAVFDRKILHYFNTFKFKSPEDFLYFTLLAFEQFKINPLEAPLILSGQITEQAALYKLLYRYIRNIDFTNLTLQGIDDGTLPGHINFDLSAFDKHSHSVSNY